MRWILAITLILAATGCRVFAGKSDYADYRSIRLARDPDERLYAMQRYAERHPDGLWSQQVAVERAGRETETFETGKSTRYGLERYLRAYPEGTFAAQARSRLAAVELIERRKLEEQEQARQLAAARKQREEELSRTWVTRFAGYWANTLIKLGGWGQAIPEVAQKNPQFSRAFGATPRPRCTAEECIKYYASPYGIPVPGGTRVERVLSMALRLRMREGKLDRAELLMPSHGFSRWYELEHRKVIAASDLEGRKAAVNWAFERLQEAIKPNSAEFSALASYTLAPIPAPAIAASGELTDTTAEDPSEPGQQLTAAQEGKPQPDIETLVKPKADQPAADMVFTPLGITKEGRTFSTEAPGGTPTAPVAPAPAEGEVMVMAPLAVPKDGEVAGTPAPAAAPPGAAAAPAVAASETSEPVAASLRAFQARGLRVVFFAAASDATNAGAYDGVIVERAASAPAAATKAPAPKRAAPR